LDINTNISSKEERIFLIVVKHFLFKLLGTGPLVGYFQILMQNFFFKDKNFIAECSFTTVKSSNFVRGP